MRIGFMLPNIGPAAGPEALVQVAQGAEALGYDNLWTTERLLAPVQPRTPYPASADGVLPAPFKISLDPLDTLAYVAGQTSRIGLGTSVMNIPFYNPVVLARRLTTVDVLSGGRLRVGLGLGWSQDEYEAAGVVTKKQGDRAEEFLQVLKAIWTSDPAEFQGRYFRLPRSVIQPKPVQKPHPPIYLAAYVPSALRRAATLANGWFPVGIPIDGMKPMIEQFRALAQEAGRDPNALEVIVRANISRSERPLGKERPIFYGSPDEIRADVEAVRALNPAEIAFDVTFSPNVKTADDFLVEVERLRELVPSR